MKEDSKTSGGRKCTRCELSFPWEGFHKKGNRFASRCKSCIINEKREYRKRLRDKQTLKANRGVNDKFICTVRGRLTPALIEDVSDALAELIRITGG